MKRIIQLIVLSAVVSLLWYCSPKVLPPSSAELSQLKLNSPDVDTSAIAKGYDVFAQNCHKCHGLKNPSNYTHEEWNSILPKMAKRAKITTEQTSLVHEYVMTFSKKN